jgi:hypothetical protein
MAHQLIRASEFPGNVTVVTYYQKLALIQKMSAQAGGTFGIFLTISNEHVPIFITAIDSKNSEIPSGTFQSTSFLQAMYIHRLISLTMHQKFNTKETKTVIPKEVITHIIRHYCGLITGAKDIVV